MHLRISTKLSKGVHDAAKLNILASQMPRLAKQPDTIVTFQYGDFVHKTRDA